MTSEANTGTKRNRIAVWSVIVVFLCLGFGTVMLKGFIDFPCFAYYDEENRCFQSDDYIVEQGYNDRIQVFLDTSLVGFSGMGCHMDGSENNRFEMKTPALHLKFERIDEKILLNGKELPPGEEFTFTNFWNLNPWTIYTIRLTNYGDLPYCQKDAPSRIIVKGEYENKVSVIKAAACLIIVLTGIRFIFNRRKSAKSS